MKKLFRILPLISFAFLAFASCDKDTKKEPEKDPPVTVTPTDNTKGTLKLEFNNLVEDQPLVFGTSYTNPTGEEYKVSKLKYYISNIVLIKNDNAPLSITNYYHIVNHADENSRTITLNGVTSGSYKAVKFTLGVDSARNRSGVQSGALDPAVAQEMYWSWTQGYVFLIFEGTSPESSQTNKGLAYHMGGFGGANKTQRSYEINFVSQQATVSSAATPTIILNSNVNEIFKSPNSISFATLPSVLSAGSNAKMIADNYADMFSLGSIKNQ